MGMGQMVSQLLKAGIDRGILHTSAPAAPTPAAPTPAAPTPMVGGMVGGLVPQITAAAVAQNYGQAPAAATPTAPTAPLSDYQAPVAAEVDMEQSALRKKRGVPSISGGDSAYQSVGTLLG